LREDIERQMQSGTNGQAAFDAAVKKIGPDGVLKSEFRKSNGAAAALEKLMMTVAALFVAFGIFLTSVTMILCYGSFGERFAGFTALGALLLAVFGLPNATSFYRSSRTNENDSPLRLSACCWVSERPRFTCRSFCRFLTFGATA
jgi:hypothetical protein